MYFSNFPKTFYEFKSTGTTHELIDILARVKFRFRSVFSGRPHTVFSVSQGDTPDIIAHKFYGSSEWWWLVLLYNDVINPFEDLPRLGFDRTRNNDRFRGGSTSNIVKGPNKVRITRKNPVAYINRVGGDDRRDFQSGDIIMKTTSVNNSAKTEVTIGQRGKQKVLTQTTGPEIDLDTSTRVAKKIVSWDPSLKEAALDSKGTGTFSEGDGVAVVVKDPQTGIFRPVVHGVIKKYFQDPLDSISHFIDNRTGGRVDPHFDPIEDKLQNLYASTYHGPANGTVGREKIEGTILDTFMQDGSIKPTDNVLLQNYQAITEQEQIQSLSDSFNRLKLLDPDYKFDALNLVKDLMRGQRYAAFESTQLYNSSERINIRGSGETTTSRLY